MCFFIHQPLLIEIQVTNAITTPPAAKATAEKNIRTVKPRRVKKTTTRLARQAREVMDTNFRSILDSDKWMLESGRYVEDILHSVCQTMNDIDFLQSPFRSWIVVVDSDTTGERPPCFLPTEWEEIVATAPTIPPPNVELVKQYCGVCLFHVESPLPGP